jgi:hypothetical protein
MVMALGSCLKWPLTSVRLGFQTTYTKEMNNKLMKVMSLNELFKAIEGMASRKAPGNDISH